MLSDVSAEPALRLWSGKLPEWMFDAKNLVFDEVGDENWEASQGTKEKAAETFTQDLEEVNCRKGQGLRSSLG